MKKFLAFVLIFLLTFSATQASNIFYNPVEEYQQSQELIDTQGIKSWLIKRSMRKIAKKLRRMDDTEMREKVKEFMPGGKPTKKKVDTFMNQRYKIADKLDELANKYEYATTEIQTEMRNILTPYFGYDFAHAAVFIFDLLAF